MLPAIETAAAPSAFPAPALAVAPTVSAASLERYHALDGVRAGAMLLGISIHAVVSFMVNAPVDWPVRDVRRNIGFDVLAGWLHSFRMPLFFLVAGFFAHLLLQRRGTRGFVRHRLVRIGLPLVLGLASVVPLIAVVSVYAAANAGLLPAHSDGFGAVVEHFRSGQFFRTLNTVHLWFLYYLLAFYGIALALVAMGRLFSLGRWFAAGDVAMRKLVGSPWKALVLAVPTALALCLMQSPSFDNPVSFAYQPRLLLAYGIFFGFGWWLHRQPELLAELRRGAGRQLLLGLLLVFPLYLVLALKHIEARGAPGAWLKPAMMSAHALSTWLTVLGALGLALRYLGQPRPFVRYLADSSYWLYLIHPPLVIGLQLQFARVELPAGIKFLAIHLLAVPLMLLSYQLLVRETLIGRVLNGPRATSRGV